MKTSIIFLTAMMLVSLLGCEQYILQIPDRGQTNLTVVNASENRPFLRVVADQSSATLPSTGTTTTMPISASVRRLEFFRSEESSSFMSGLNLTFAPNKHYLVIVFDQLAGVAFDSRADELPPVPAGKALVRILHFANYDDDVKIMQGDSPLFRNEQGQARPFFFPEDYVSGFQEIETGTLSIAVQDFFTNEQLAETSSALEAGKHYSILVYGRTSSGIRATIFNHDVR